MKLTLTTAEKADLLPKIKRVLDTGEPWEDETMHQPVDAIVSAILEINGVTRQELEDPRYGIDLFDTNGWQWDWWQEFSYRGKRYTLSGSGYHGGHTFHLSDHN